MWMRLKNPNIVRCLGATADPLQIVMDLMPNGEVMNYVERNPSTNRVHLVSSLAFTGKEIVQCGCGMVTLGIGLDSRALLPPFPRSDSWRRETGLWFTWHPFVQLSVHGVKAKYSRERQG